jgi:hypothetical protein
MKPDAIPEAEPIAPGKPPEPVKVRFQPNKIDRRE